MAGIWRDLHQAAFRRADFRPRLQIGRAFFHELRECLGTGTPGCGGLTSQWLSFRVLAGLELRTVLGREARYGHELRVGRNLTSVGWICGLGRAAYGQGTALWASGDHRVHSRPGARALDLPIVRFSLQGLGRRGHRGLLFLSGRFWIACAEPETGPRDRI